MSNLRTSVVLSLSGNLQARAKTYTNAIDNMAKRGSRSMNMLRRSTLAMGKGLDAMSNRYVTAIGGMGIAYKSAQAVMVSGSLDKRLIRLRQTAGATKDAAAILRAELHKMAEETGQSVDSLLNGFNNLIQSGMSWEAALATIKATNNAMAVTGSMAEVLTSGMTVAAEAFDFDLSKVETSVLLLDKMIVAGRLGNAELEDLSGIFARVGVNAKRAGLGSIPLLVSSSNFPLSKRIPNDWPLWPIPLCDCSPIRTIFARLPRSPRSISTMTKGRNALPSMSSRRSPPSIAV